MKENITLEKNQEKEFKQIITQLSFTAAYKNVVCNEMPTLDIEKRGIKLHFLRYGLFDVCSDYSVPTTSYSSPDSAAYFKAIFFNEEKKATVGKVINEKPSESELKNQDFIPFVQLNAVIMDSEIPANENFSVSKTPLRAGYVYMINDQTPHDDFKEFRVDDFGLLHEILWSKNKKDGSYLDVRTTFDLGIMYKILDRNNQTYCFAFSPVQWKANYVKELLDSKEKRGQRCKVKVLCKGIPKDGETNNMSVSHYNNTPIVVSDRNPMAYKYREILTRIADDEKRQDKLGGNILLEDMFIILDDPIGCANEICVGIDSEILRLKAMMASLQTGKSTVEILSMLQKGEQLPKSDTEKSRQIQYLHRLAQLTYDFVYNNHDNSEKYNSDVIKNTVANRVLDFTVGGVFRPFTEQKGVEKIKLEKILGVEERKVQRKVINTYRDDLGTFLKSDYYQDATDDYMNSIPDRIEDAKGVIAVHFIALGSYPNMYDRHLDLTNVYEPKKDPWYIHINETLYNENPSVFNKSTKILDYKIDIQDMFVLSIINKTVGVIERIIKAYANHDSYIGAFIKLKQKKLPIPVKSKISYFRDKNTRVATFKFKALEEFETKINNRNLRFEINGEKATLHKYKKYWHLEYTKMTKQSAEALIKNKKLEVNLKGNLPKRFKGEAEKVLKSNAFGGLVVLIEVFVLSKAVNSFLKDPSYRGFEKFGFASVQLGAASMSLIEKMNLYENHLAKKGFVGEIFRSSMDDFSKNIAKLKIVSSAITVFTASRDSYRSFSVRDNDAAALFGMAAGIGAVFLFADVTALIGGGVAVFALGFWPAALLGGALLGCYYLAQKYFVDTQLEGYFKNFPLSDYALPPKDTELPHDYINRLVSHSTATVINPWFVSAQAKEYTSFSNFEKAYTAFLDIAIPSLVVLEPEPNAGYVAPIKGFDIHNVSTNRFRASIYSVQNISEFYDLDIKAWFYPFGIKAPLKKGRRFEITTFISSFPEKSFLFDADKMTPNCIVSFGLPDLFYWRYMDYPDGEVLFTFRVRVQDDEYTPSDFNHNKRYVFTNAQLHNKVNNNTRYMTSIFTAHRYQQPINVRKVKLQNMSEEEAMQKPKIVTENSIKMLASYRTK